MSFRNINKLFLCLFLIFLSSCKTVEILKIENIVSKKEVSKNNKINEEAKSLNIILNEDISDYYKKVYLIKELPENKFKKLGSFSSYQKKYYNSNSLQNIISNNYIMSLNYKSEIQFIDLEKFKINKKIIIDYDFENKNIYPTSWGKLNNSFYAAYSDGTLINFNKNGNVQWVNNFKGILKTPIKIIDNNIIIMNSDSIISVNSQTGNINWNFKYQGNFVLSANGGDIINYKHILYFILPNKQIGEVDTIFAEKTFTKFSEINFIESIDNSKDKLHNFKNLLFYFDENKILTSINIKDNSIINKFKFQNIKSSYFIGNNLLLLNNANILKFYSLNRNSILWDLNVSKLLKKNDTIVSTFESIKAISIFFKSGLFIQINKDGNLLISQNLRIKNIINVSLFDQFFFIDQENGKTTIFSK